MLQCVAVLCCSCGIVLLTSNLRSCPLLPHAATRCNTLQHAATRCNTIVTRWNYPLLPLPSLLLQQAQIEDPVSPTVDDSFIYVAHGSHKNCSTLQHNATHCKTLQLSSRLQSTTSSATLLTVVQRTATHHNTPQHTATHCNYPLAYIQRWL